MEEGREGGEREKGRQEYGKESRGDRELCLMGHKIRRHDLP